MSGFSLFDLNPEQEQAVRTTEGPLLILAGAGTGKTRVITMRVAFLISQGVDPAHILAVTFTNKAADEMRERLAKMIEPARAKKVTMSTFHALCVRILRQDIEKLGWKKNFSIYDEGDQMGLIKKIITRTAAKDEKLDPNVAKNLISKAKNNGWRESTPGDEKSLAGAVFARYQAELKTLNAVDFDDLLLLAVKLLSEHADVRDRWHRRFRYLMVDEFQDTNRLQLELVTMLAKPSADQPGHRPNIAVVGDDDQSIYGWRGAEVSNILEFEAHFPDPVVVKLEQNYRSTNAILNTANHLIKNNPRRRPKKLWSAAGDGEKVRIVGMSDDRQEAEFITNEIAQRAVTESAGHEDFAILFRMNAQSRLIETNLRQLNIPYRIIGGKSFFDRREVKDLLAYANCLVNTDDDVSLLRIINTPARGISSTTVENATEFSAKNKCSVFDALRNEEFRSTLMKRTVDSIDRFTELLDGFETKLNTPLSDHAVVLRELIKETGYMEDLRRTCKTPEEALSRETNLVEMMKSFEVYQGRSTEGLRGFLDEMSLRQEREDDDDDAKGSGVTLITLHAAKGLEYPHVYLIGLEEGLIPHDRSKLEGTVDEERRLLYVGITRARKTLAMSWCRNRIKYGSAMPCMASSFIKELPPEWINHRDATQILSAPVSEAAAKSKFGALRAAVERAAG
ncbi:MAG TPA: UvrD-helicase domain-containing protein [Chthoniobacter sp.]|nr:UvrD-helicase domain-containing protein [Chthoniobacter sp.]